MHDVCQWQDVCTEKQRAQGGALWNTNWSEEPQRKRRHQPLLKKLCLISKI